MLLNLVFHNLKNNLYVAHKLFMKFSRHNLFYHFFPNVLFSLLQWLENLKIIFNIQVLIDLSTNFTLIQIRVSCFTVLCVNVDNLNVHMKECSPGMSPFNHTEVVVLQNPVGTNDFIGKTLAFFIFSDRMNSNTYSIK